MKYLNESLDPVSYKLHFNLDLINDKFNGINNIHIECIKPTKLLQFHAENLTLDEIIFNNLLIPLNLLQYDNENNICSIFLNDTIPIGNHNLTIKFSSVFGKDKEYGLVKFTSNRISYFTIFEPNHARKCFPCWDEPGYKVKYNVSIEINDLSYSVLFNTNILKIENGPKTIKYTFKETIPMSTYVMSFMVGKYNFIEALTKNKVKLRVHVPSDIIDIKVGNYALTAGVKFMDYMCDIFDAPYPFEKMDFVPIDDIMVGGMENYGLIFYKLKYLLFDKKYTTIEGKLGILVVISHEIAHQWFGNLISIDDWGDLWLKESFATFFEYIMIEQLYPDVDVRSFLVKNTIQTQYFDQLSNRTISSNILSNNKINDIYDDVTYHKGCSLLFILYDFLGSDHFIHSLKEYLNKHKFNIITCDNFIDAITCNLTKDKQIIVKQIINSYTNTRGIPMINFSENKITINNFNKNFIAYKMKDNDNFEIGKWTIPIKYYNNNKISYCIISENTHQTNKCIKPINDKQFSYYRLCYDKVTFSYVLKNIKYDSDYIKMSIYDDLFVTGIYCLNELNFWIIYHNKLIEELLTINNPFKFNSYLIDNIYSSINSIEHIFNSYFVTNNKSTTKSYNNFISLIKKPFDNLINHLNNVFNATNIDTFTKNLLDDQFHYNSILVLLFKINNKNKNSVADYILNNDLFEISGDINREIICYVVNHNYFNKLIKINKMYEQFNFSIFELFSNTKNIDIVEYLFNIIFPSKLNNSINTIALYKSDLLLMIQSNQYFLKLLVDFIIKKNDFFVALILPDSEYLITIIKEIINKLYRLNLNVIKQFLIKLKEMKNENKISHTNFKDLNANKNHLYDEIFTQTNIINSLGEIN